MSASVGSCCTTSPRVRRRHAYRGSAKRLAALKGFGFNSRAHCWQFRGLPPKGRAVEKQITWVGKVSTFCACVRRPWLCPWTLGPCPGSNYALGWWGRASFAWVCFLGFPANSWTEQKSRLCRWPLPDSAETVSCWGLGFSNGWSLSKFVCVDESHLFVL